METAEGCGTTHLDCGHDTPLGSGERPIMLLAISATSSFGRSIGPGG
jgi:hypothetical protein